MIKRLIAVGTSLGLVAAFTPALAMPDFQASDVVPSNGRATVSIPAHAAEVAPGVFSLGERIDPGTGEKVEGFAIVHPRRNFDHKPNHNPGGGNGGGKPGGDAESSCFSPLAKGAVWNVAEDYVVDPTNIAGLVEAEVTSLLATGIATWEAEVTVEIFGDEVAGVVDGLVNEPDGTNEVFFGDIDSPGAIGVTEVWGIFSGPPFNRQLTEWNMVFDDVDFAWATDGDLNSMDFLNITVHELGHALGLGHPSDSCTEETMYRFSTEGEIKKRDLNAGDIAGVVELY